MVKVTNKYNLFEGICYVEVKDITTPEEFFQAHYDLTSMGVINIDMQTTDCGVELSGTYSLAREYWIDLVEVVIAYTRIQEGSPVFKWRDLKHLSLGSDHILHTPQRIGEAYTDILNKLTTDQ